MFRHAILLVLLALGRPLTGAPDIEADAREVFHRITQASGVSGQPPAFVIQSEAERKANRLKRQIAWYDYSANTVGIDRKTLDLCSKFADPSSCIAVFLGHELAHFYKDHRWGGDFGSRFASTDLGVKIRALTSTEVLIYETQADDAGGIYSYLAGYDTLALSASVLNAVYAAYALPANLPGYPSLAERKQIAQKSAARLEALIPVFEAGTLLLGIGRYEDAARCFDHVAQTFPGGAELNNAGVAYILAAASLFPKEANAAAYPWTIDGESRLEPRTHPRSKGALTESPEHERKRLTDLAESRLAEALRRDPAYQPALVNLAFLEHLTGKRGTARDRMAQSADSTAKAIVAADTAPSLDNVHLQPVSNQIRTDEKIANLSPEDIPLKGLAVSAALDPKLTILSRSHLDHWEIVIHSSAWQAEALVTRPTYKGETAHHVRLGSAWQQALQAYGQSSSKRWVIFEDFGLALAGSATVEKWLVFNTSQ